MRLENIAGPLLNRRERFTAVAAELEIHLNIVIWDPIWREAWPAIEPIYVEVHRLRKESR